MKYIIKSSGDIGLLDILISRQFLWQSDFVLNLGEAIMPTNEVQAMDENKWLLPDIVGYDWAIRLLHSFTFYLWKSHNMYVYMSHCWFSQA